jgi:predicted DNA-binding transcriptional regulator YafY
MSKAERLFALVTMLRGRRTAVTALELARALHVSERTIYRDIAALVGSGIPLEGEAGVGYRLAAHAHLPPLMFDPEEAIAIAVGLRLVRAATDPELGLAAERAERRVRAVLTDAIKQKLDRLPYRIPVLERHAALRARHAQVRRAAAEKWKLAISYVDEAGRPSERIVWPLALMGWGDRWTVLAWCESRQAYRNFRLDRIGELERLDEPFETSETLSIAHYFKTELGIDDIS